MGEVQRLSVGYPGGLAARYRWAGSGQADEVFALTEQGGALTDHAVHAGGDPARMCRAELRVESPLGQWTARFASPVFDEPAGLLWDTEALLIIKYGFVAYALGSRTGELAWTYTAGTPIVAVLGSARLDHVIVQSEVETVALDDAGRVRWRVTHSDVISRADLVAGTLTLTSYGGEVAAFDPANGRSLR
jgi:outer membrane protein assembly factor BamB